MDKSTPGRPTPDTYVDIENRIIDKYFRRIGVSGFAVYVMIKRHLDHTPTHCPPSYATIARKLGIDQGAVIRHVKKLQRLHLLPPSLRFKEEGES
jgi:DNA-binding MarR family transcriptional regulator